MTPMPNCIFCNTATVEYQSEHETSIFSVKCNICGRYKSEDFNEKLTFVRLTPHDKAMISAYTRELYELDAPAPELHMLNEENQIEIIIARYKNKTVIDKLNNLVLYVGRNSDYFGKPMYFHEETDYPITYSKNKIESDNIKNQAFEAGYFKLPNSGGNVVLTWEGWQKFETLKEYEIPSKKCFVAMWCDLIEVYRAGIEPVIQELGYEPIFIEREEHNEKICDLVIAEIRSCRFLIADVTGQRQNVYYEAGFAQGLNRDVIWTCRHDEIDKAHFDTRQYNHIVWENTEDLKKKLVHRIKATIL